MRFQVVASQKKQQDMPSHPTAIESKLQKITRRSRTETWIKHEKTIKLSLNPDAFADCEHNFNSSAPGFGLGAWRPAPGPQSRHQKPMQPGGKSETTT